VLTSSGDVLSWGLNRFSQLGYVVEIPNSRNDEPIQSSARKVAGALKNKFILGVAACRMASVAWSDTMVYAWGTNNGQLGLFMLVCHDILYLISNGTSRFPGASSGPAPGNISDR
jgi:alpha-tubulin suppressor-like RCC1 family protein